MKILTVIPIAKGIPRDELSYFSAKQVGLGTMVTVPFGGRKIKAIVIDENEVRDLKQSIKNESYSLKNILEIHADGLPYCIFASAQKTARFFGQPAGAILETMVPKPLFEKYLSNPTPPLPEAREGARNADIQSIQAPYRERISIYKTMIRENMARNSSTMVIAPTVIQAETLFAELKLGIDDRIFALHGKVSKKKLESNIKNVFERETPIVVIATPPYSSVLRNDWASFIVEQSSSHNYRYDFKPNFDMRLFLEQFALACRARVIYADTLLDIGIRTRINKREIIENRNTWHIAKPENFRVTDMKPDERPDTVRISPIKSDILGIDACAMLTAGIKDNANIMLLSQRKGIAPMTTCVDCGTVVSCPVCDTPLVLHRKKPNSAERIYMCHHCLTSSIALDYCKNCNGSRFKMFGITTETIRAEVEKIFPTARTFLIDGDNAATPAAVSKTISAWQEESGILIATQAMLPYIPSADMGCIVSMDSMLSMPSYTSGENAVYSIVSFLEKISRAAIVQTRMHSHEAVQAIEREDLHGFMKSELESRIQFGYPPEKILLKISLDAKKTDAKDASVYLETIFKKYDPDILMKKSRDIDNSIIQAVMKIEPTLWNDENSRIQQIVREMPREFTREVNPDSVI
ncbi:MAG: helicase PriA [Patescibacteria group bacterium]|nr:helicase PriA [Patescibacteria group bacterium]